MINTLATSDDIALHISSVDTSETVVNDNDIIKSF